MNALGPPKKERGELASKTARKLIAWAHYATLALLANIFRSPFWFFEQRRGRLQDRIDNRESDR